MSLQNPHFLYVEDDPLSREILSILLTQVMGFSSVHVFENTENFMERIHGLPEIPDVIFLDIQMRPYDGYAALNMLRAEEQYRHSKIIALTASVMAADVAHLKGAGFDGLISKPIKQRHFPDMLRRILDGQDVWSVL